MDISDNTHGLLLTVQMEIIRLRQGKISCSQATFIGVCRAAGCSRSEEDLLALSAGFRGGTGCSYNEGSCGALMAGVMALGMLLPEDNAKAVALSKELFEHFKERYGTVICGNIVYHNGFAACTDCCLCVGRKVIGLLCREQVLTQKDTLNRITSKYKQ